MPSSYDKLDSVPEEDGKDAAINELAQKLEEITESRNEERFCWCLAFIVLLDVYFFAGLEGWGAPISIFLLELVLLIILARRFGVEDLTNILDKYVLSHPLNPMKNRNSNNPDS
jgi:hypothetical protein